MYKENVKRNINKYIEKYSDCFKDFNEYDRGFVDGLKVAINFIDLEEETFEQIEFDFNDLL